MFKAAQKLKPIPGHAVHVFENQVHFQAWMQVHKPANVVPITANWNGPKRYEVNHIGECDFEVDDKMTELECAA